MTVIVSPRSALGVRRLNEVAADNFTDARPFFRTSITGDNPTFISTLPWKLGRTAIERSTAFQRDRYKPHIFRFESLADDPLNFEGGVTTTHNEVQTMWSYMAPTDPARSGAVAFDLEFWQAWSFYVDPGPESAANWTIIGQWHATEDGFTTSGGTRSADDSVSPPFCLNLLPGDFLQIITRTDSAAQQTAANPPAYRPEYQGPKITRGRWYSVVTNMIFNWSGAGKCCVWINGTQVLNKTAYSIGYNDFQGHHWNFGVYRGLYNTPGDVSTLTDPNPFAIRYANMEYSTSSLASRITSPLPT